MFVYVITNKVNGKQYIGQTSKSIEQRWQQHVAEVKRCRNRHLYNAIEFYGVENFEIVPLVEVNTKREMDFYEKALIRVLDLRNSEKGYNLTDGGGGMLGFKQSEELKHRRSEIMKTLGISPPSFKGKKRRPFSEEHKKKLSEIARNMSDETKEKIRIARFIQDCPRTGKTHSEETKLKMSESHKKMSGETRNKMGKVTRERWVKFKAAGHIGRIKSLKESND